MLVLKYHRRISANIFDRDIFRSTNIPKNDKYTTLMKIFMHLEMSVLNILAHWRVWYFKTIKILWKLLQTWFILLHLVLVWSVRIKSIWTHSAPPPCPPRFRRLRSVLLFYKYAFSRLRQKEMKTLPLLSINCGSFCATISLQFFAWHLNL